MKCSVLQFYCTRHKFHSFFVYDCLFHYFDTRRLKGRYRQQEFVRIGYYLRVDYRDDEYIKFVEEWEEKHRTRMDEEDIGEEDEEDDEEADADEEMDDGEEEAEADDGNILVILSANSPNHVPPNISRNGMR